jgi:hypothetical protein
MSEVFFETLLTDDNDANLGNGTPHGNEIVNAFNLHGIGTGFFLSSRTRRSPIRSGAGPYNVTATIQYTGPIGSLDASSPTLHFQCEPGALRHDPDDTDRQPESVPGSDPGSERRDHQLLHHRHDTYGGQIASPPGAPTRGTNVFLAGRDRRRAVPRSRDRSGLVDRSARRQRRTGHLDSRESGRHDDRRPAVQPGG